MTSKQRLTVFFICSSVLCFGAFTLQKSWNDAQDARIAKQYCDDRKALVNQIVTMQGVAIDKLVEDYSVWEDLFSFEGAPDQKWAEQNVDTAVSSYNLSNLWLLNSNGKVIHEAVSGSSSCSWPFGSNPPLPDGPTQSKFYYSVGGKVQQFRIQRLHSSTDKTLKNGYLVTSSELSSDVLSQLGKALQSQVSLLGPSAGQISSQGAQFEMGVPLNDASGKPVATLNIQSHSKLLERLGQRSSQTFIQLVAGVVVLAIGLILVLRGHVVISRKELQLALESHSSEQLAKSIGADAAASSLVGFIDSHADQTELQGINLELESELHIRARELEFAVETTIQAFIELLDTRQDAFTDEQRHTIMLADYFAEHLDMSQESRLAIRHGAMIKYFEQNQGEPLQFLDLSAVTMSEKFSPILAIANHSCLASMDLEGKFPIEYNTFAVVEYWMTKCPKIEPTFEECRQAAEAVIADSGGGHDAWLVCEFLKMI
ncbi:MAG: hypothetical protein JNM34_09055, partial [Chthonomonadaceae bacterium]|nr:hypothetical protein [Chthonomonadaceae bacterium]